MTGKEVQNDSIRSTAMPGKGTVVPDKETIRARELEKIRDKFAENFRSQTKSDDNTDLYSKFVKGPEVDVEKMFKDAATRALEQANATPEIKGFNDAAMKKDECVGGAFRDLKNAIESRGVKPLPPNYTNE